MNDHFHIINKKKDVMSFQAPVPSPTPKKKKKASTGHAKKLPPSMYLSQINAQYKFGEVTDIPFGDIFSHVIERVISVQAMAQQYMADKMHSCSTMIEQEVPVICYGSSSKALYLQLDHNHCIISILFIHVMKHYNFQLPAISDKNFFTKFMNAIDHINPFVLTLIINNLMAPTPHPSFHSHTNPSNLSFLYLSMGCQMTCLKYIFSNKSTDITTNSALTDLIDH
eukprot:m51a1_g14072 hypothetical protein (225) ;mRNA; f:1264845-1269827